MRSRPLSPHLGVYKFMYTMALSIFHRITGVALSAGLLLLAYWLMALAGGEDSYERAYRWMSHWTVQVLLAGWLFAFVYHLCNGIRHLTWDAGYGLEKHEARRSATVTVLATLVIFAALAYLTFAVRNGIGL
jgi:succinate dehydrogenase / fumarate reductase cytochrome b subunit